MNSNKFNICLLFLIATADFFALGVVLTTFAPLFTSSSGLFAATVSATERLYYLGIAFMLAPLGQLLSNPVLGNFSDLYGRKKLLLMTLTGSTLSILLSALAIQGNSYILLLVGQLLTGLCSGNITIAQASMADMTRSSRDKPSRFNILQIGVGFGMLLGPLAGGWLLAANLTIGFAAAFYVAFVFSGVVLLLTRCFYTETERLVEIKTLDWLAGIKTLGLVFHAKGIRVLLLTWFVFMLGWDFYMRYFANFLQGSSLAFNFHQIGDLFSYLGLVYLFCQVTLIQPATRWLTANKVIAPASLAVAVFIFLMGLATQSTFLYIVITCYIVSIALFIPNFNAVLSDQASQRHQGSAFGMAVSLHALSMIIASLVGSYLLIYSVRLPLLGGGLLILLSSIILLVSKKVSTKK